MKVGDLVQYRPGRSTWEVPGIILAKRDEGLMMPRYFISWPGKPEHIGKQIGWLNVMDVELISESW